VGRQEDLALLDAELARLSEAAAPRPQSPRTSLRAGGRPLLERIVPAIEVF
jgi:hypothetical protein